MGRIKPERLLLFRLGFNVIFTGSGQTESRRRHVDGHSSPGLMLIRRPRSQTNVDSGVDSLWEKASFPQSRGRGNNRSIVRIAVTTCRSDVNRPVGSVSRRPQTSLRQTGPALPDPRPGASEGVWGDTKEQIKSLVASENRKEVKEAEAFRSGLARGQDFL